MRVEKGELQIILKEIYALKARYQPVSIWPVIWRNLVDFCRSRGFKVSETKDLISRKGIPALGVIYPQLRIIRIRIGNITEMVPVLAHETGHLIALKAGIFQKYNYDEGIADALGDQIMDLLSR